MNLVEDATGKKKTLKSQTPVSLDCSLCVSVKTEEEEEDLCHVSVALKFPSVSTFTAHLGSCQHALLFLVLLRVMSLRFTAQVWIKLILSKIYLQKKCVCSFCPCLLELVSCVCV